MLFHLFFLSITSTILFLLSVCLQHLVCLISLRSNCPPLPLVLYTFLFPFTATTYIEFIIIKRFRAIRRCSHFIPGYLFKFQIEIGQFTQKWAFYSNSSQIVCNYSGLNSSNIIHNFFLFPLACICLCKQSTFFPFFSFIVRK